MGKKKKPKKKKPRILPSLSPEEEAHLSSLLENLKKIDLSQVNEEMRSAHLALAFVERLPADDPDAVNVVLGIQESFPQKDVQKAIRKALFRIKQKGILVPEAISGGFTQPLIRQPEKAEPVAYLGPIDGAGNRGIFFVLPQIPRGVDLGMGVVNDESGFVQFIYGKYSKKRMREVKALFFERFHHMVQTSPAHAATVLERAYSRSEEPLHSHSSDYLQLRPWILENVVLLDRPAVYDFISPQSEAESILTDSQIEKLFGHEFMKSWIVDPEEIKPFLDELSGVEESPILVSEPQKLQRFNEIKEKAVAQFFPESKRSIIRSRLEEMAYVFFKLAEEDYAHICLAAGNSFNDKDSLLQVNPVLKFMLERTLAYYSEARQDVAAAKKHGEEASSRIIIP